MKLAATLLFALLAGCAFPGKAPELDITGVPYTPYVGFHTYVDGTGAVRDFRVSDDAVNFTWSVRFTPVTAGESCVGVPDALPTIILLDPSGTTRHTSTLAGAVVSAPEGCTPEIRQTFDAIPGQWRVRYEGQGNVLGAASAS